MLNAIPVVYFLYAVALFGGGYMGYKSANSLPSLIGSSLFAVLAIAAGIISLSNKHTGLLLGLETAMLVIGLFIFRFIQTGKPMPAFGAIGLSVIVAALTVMAVAQMPRDPAKAPVETAAQ